MEANISLSTEQAAALCKDYLEHHKPRLFSQCWGCVKYSKGIPEKMCFYEPPDNNACSFVNIQYRASKT